jgi:hypothetical protein
MGDLRSLEEAFCMGGGYVLEFSNRTFGEFLWTPLAVGKLLLAYRTRDVAPGEPDAQGS